MLIVRAADVDDARAIARVHVDTWRSTYTGIIPQDYLDGMTIENRTLVWARLLQRGGPSFPTLVSEDHDRRIIGFVSGGPLRHRDSRYQAEISSLYVLPGHQRGATMGAGCFSLPPIVWPPRAWMDYSSGCSPTIRRGYFMKVWAANGWRKPNACSRARR